MSLWWEEDPLGWSQIGDFSVLCVVLPKGPSHELLNASVATYESESSLVAFHLRWLQPAAQVGRQTSRCGGMVRDCGLTNMWGPWKLGGVRSFVR